ncbi:hypothetical protein DV515_00016713 [Chloebia gouldiae]|uniref:Uncharacterized protein n=1 Tax=Chloebia gouldiae TaxID=44316 RepID=A0A3L8RAY7_CHLGU|nr:hypothetical protein DV515_00016713 [Chloebia gouldiae]
MGQAGLGTRLCPTQSHQGQSDQPSALLSQASMEGSGETICAGQIGGIGDGKVRILGSIGGCIMKPEFASEMSEVGT